MSSRFPANHKNNSNDIGNRARHRNLGIIASAIIGGIVSWWIFNRQKKTSHKQDYTLSRIEQLENYNEKLLEKIKVVEENNENLLEKIFDLNKKIDSLLEGH